jgi:NADH pyrophosphatase NudC (nudix superfamily)
MFMKPRQVFRAYPNNTEQSNEAVATHFCGRCGAQCKQEYLLAGLRSTCSTCNFVHYKNPQPAIAVLVEQDNQFLLGKRISKSLGHGQWCLPCGYVEYHEDYLSAAVREVKEETLLDVRIKSIISVVTNYLKPNIHSLVTVLSAEPLHGEVSAGDGMEEVSWFPYTGEFPEMAFEADTHIISRYFETDLVGAPIDSNFASR